MIIITVHTLLIWPQHSDTYLVSLINQVIIVLICSKQPASYQCNVDMISIRFCLGRYTGANTESYKDLTEGFRRANICRY